MHFGVALMMDLSVSVFDERLLLFYRNDNPLPRISIRRNNQQSVRISLHHLQVSFLIQVPLRNLLP